MPSHIPSSPFSMSLHILTSSKPSMKATGNASQVMASIAASQVNDPRINDRIGTRPVSERSTGDVRGGAQAARGAVGAAIDGQGGRQPQAGSSTSAQEGESRHFRTPISSSGEITPPGTSQSSSSVLADQQQQSGPDPLAKLKKQVEDLNTKINQAEDLEKENKRKKAAAAAAEEAEGVKEARKELLDEVVRLNKRFEGFNFEERLAVNILKVKEEIKKPEPDGSPTAVDSKELNGETPKEPSAEQLKRIEEAESEALGEFFLKEREARVKKSNKTRWTPWGKTKRSITSLDIENQLTPKLPDSYLEIKRLLWVEGQRVQKKALEVWRDKEILFTKRVERKKSKVAELKNEVYQLIGFFSVFQGVVLTAVAQASLLGCNNRWSPISLSILASIVTIAGVIQKLIQISDFQKTVHSEEQSLKEVITRVWDLRRRAETFRFARFFDNREKPQQRRSQQVFYSAFVIISLVAFTVLFPVSHWRILCDSSH